MPCYAFEGSEPRVHPTAFVAPTATLIGRVVVGPGASIWYGVVLRADFDEVSVEEGANVQDNSVVHCGVAGVPARIGAGVTVGHLCVVHGAVLGDRCLIGNGAVVLDGAHIGVGALVAAGAVVLPAADIPDGMIAAGIPAVVKRAVDGAAAEWVAENPLRYQDLSRRHRNGIHQVDQDSDQPDG